MHQKVMEAITVLESPDALPAEREAAALRLSNARWESTDQMRILSALVSALLEAGPIAEAVMIALAKHQPALSETLRRGDARAEALRERLCRPWLFIEIMSSAEEKSLTWATLRVLRTVDSGYDLRGYLQAPDLLCYEAAIALATAENTCRKALETLLRLVLYGSESFRSLVFEDDVATDLRDVVREEHRHVLQYAFRSRTVVEPALDLLRHRLSSSLEARILQLIALGKPRLRENELQTISRRLDVETPVPVIIAAADVLADRQATRKAVCEFFTSDDLAQLPLAQLNGLEVPLLSRFFLARAYGWSQKEAFVRKHRDTEHPVLKLFVAAYR